MRLFLSLDIVGSTEFKHPRGAKAPSDDDSWVDPFLTFYRLSVGQMAVQWKYVIGEMKASPHSSKHFQFGDDPEFWKGAGDEVLFTKIVVSPLDAVAAVRSLILVMDDIRNQFVKSKQTEKLDVKGTAWLAGFPLNNTEIVLRMQNHQDRPDGEIDDRLAENYRLLDWLDKNRDKKGDFKTDYIGPSIDLGFRLCQYAKPRQMIVSADLAWLICHIYGHIGEAAGSKCPFLERPKIGFAGRVSLRGLLGGEMYPLFWVEALAGSSLDKAEDALLNIDHRGVTQFCAAFLDQSGPLRMMPYIDGYQASALGELTAERQRRLCALEDRVNETATAIAKEKESIAGTRGDGAKGAAEMRSRPTTFAEDIAQKVQAAISRNMQAASAVVIQASVEAAAAREARESFERATRAGDTARAQASVDAATTARDALESSKRDAQATSAEWKKAFPKPPPGEDR